MLRKKIGYFLPLFVWLAVLFKLSSQPRGEQSIVPLLARIFPPERLASWLPDVRLRYGQVAIEAKTSPYHFVEFVVRKSTHVVSYSVLACALYFAFYGFSGKTGRPALRLAGLLAGVGAVAAFDEWNQMRVPMRTGQMPDVWLDLFGGMIGAALLLILIRVFRSRRKKRIRHDFRASEFGHRKPPG